MLTCLPLRDRLPRYGGGGAQRQRGSGGPQGRRERALPRPEIFRIAGRFSPPPAAAGAPSQRGPRTFRPQRLAEHLQTLVQELLGLGEKAQTVDIQRAFHAGGVTAAQEQRRKGAADLALLEVAAQAPGLFLAGKDDLSLAAVGVLFGSLQAVIALLIAADVPAPAVEGRLGQIQPHLVGVTGIICGHYTAFHGLGSPYFFPRPNRLCSRPARLGRSAARCRGTGFTAAFTAAALGLDSAFGFSGLSVSCTKPFWK